MSTPAYVGKVSADGNTVKFIYVHWDGYVDDVGYELLDNYTDEADLDALLEEGNHSTIAGRVESYRSMKRGPDECEPGVCSIEEFTTERCTDQNYTYLWKDGVWIYTECHRNAWQILTKETK